MEEHLCAHWGFFVVKKGGAEEKLDQRGREIERERGEREEIGKSTFASN